MSIKQNDIYKAYAAQQKSRKAGTTKVSSTDRRAANVLSMLDAQTLQSLLANNGPQNGFDKALETLKLQGGDQAAVASHYEDLLNQGVSPDQAYQAIASGIDNEFPMDSKTRDTVLKGIMASALNSKKSQATSGAQNLSLFKSLGVPELALIAGLPKSFDPQTQNPYQSNDPRQIQLNMLKQKYDKTAEDLSSSKPGPTAAKKAGYFANGAIGAAGGAMAGGALLGAQTGSLAGPIGTIAGAGIGGLIGAVMGARATDRFDYGPNKKLDEWKAQVQGNDLRKKSVDLMINNANKEQQALSDEYTKAFQAVLAQAGNPSPYELARQKLIQSHLTGR